MAVGGDEREVLALGLHDTRRSAAGASRRSTRRRPSGRSAAPARDRRSWPWLGLDRGQRGELLVVLPRDRRAALALAVLDPEPALRVLADLDRVPAAACARRRRSDAPGPRRARGLDLAGTVIVVVTSRSVPVMRSSPFSASSSTVERIGSVLFEGTEARAVDNAYDRSDCWIVNSIRLLLSRGCLGGGRGGSGEAGPPGPEWAVRVAEPGGRDNAQDYCYSLFSQELKRPRTSRSRWICGQAR